MTPKYIVGITTYNRPSTLLSILETIEACRALNAIDRVIVIDDASSDDYSAVQTWLAARRDWVDYLRLKKKNGRERFYDTVALLFREMKRHATQQHLCIMLQDDVVFDNAFFNNCSRFWTQTKNDKKIAVNLLTDRRMYFAQWGGQPPVLEQQLNPEKQWRTDWVDGVYLFHPDLLSIVLDAPMPILHLKQERSSGVGRHISNLIRANNRVVYAPQTSLLSMLPIPSQMHPDRNLKLHESIPKHSDNAVRFHFQNRPYALEAGNLNDHILSCVRDSKAFYEADLLYAIRDMLLTGAYIDVGAHIGNHSVFFGAECPCTRLVSIEPFPENNKWLSHNLSANRITATIYNYAMSDGFCEVPMKLPNANNSGTARRCSTTDDAVAAVAQTATLDYIYPWAEPKVAVVKIDVEGDEMAVLRGGLELIHNHKPVLVIESADDAAFNDVKALLTQLGYSHSKRFCQTPTYIWTPN